MNIKFGEYISLVRPKQWTKNLIVFAAIVFVREFFNLEALIQVTQAFIVFCCVASAIYIVNDVADLEDDRRHPSKKFRPIAAGKISVSSALVLSTGLIIVSLVWSWFLSQELFFCVVAYFGLMLVYTFLLKRIVILDVLSIATGFVVRAIAGAVVISVPFSAWLLLCTFFLTLFLAISKRKSELLQLESGQMRVVSGKYSLAFISQMNAIVLPSIITTYTLYTFSSEHSNYLLLTVPVVIYGLFRYLYVIENKSEINNGPADDLFYDKPLLISVVVWGLLVLGIVTFYR